MFHRLANFVGSLCRDRWWFAGLLAFVLGSVWRVYFLVYEHPAVKFIYSDMKGYVDRGFAMAKGFPPHLFDTIFPPGMDYVIALSFTFDPTLQLAAIFLLTMALTFPLLVSILGYLTTQSKPAAAITLIVASLYFPFFNYAGFFLADMPFAFSVCLAAILSISIVRSESNKARLGLALGAGLLWGAAAALKAFGLGFMVCFVGYLFWINRHSLGYKRLFVLVPALAVGALTIVAPVSMRCSEILGRTCIISTNGSSNFLLSHQGRVFGVRWEDKSRGAVMQFTTAPAHFKGYRDIVSVDHSVLDDRANIRKGLEWSLANPWTALVTSFEHAFDLFEGSTPWPAVDGPYASLALLYNRLFIFLVLLPAFAYLLVLGARDKQAFRKQVMLALPVICLFGVSFLTIGSPRIRLATDAFTLILAVQGWILLAKEFRSQVPVRRDLDAIEDTAVASSNAFLNNAS